MLDMLMLAFNVLYVSADLSGVAISDMDVGGKSR